MWTADRTKDIITAEQRQAEADQVAWDALRAKRDRLLNDTSGPFLRHLSQREAEQQTTLSESEFATLLDYQQALRDLPENTADPANPDWPEAPDFDTD